MLQHTPRPLALSAEAALQPCDELYVEQARDTTRGT